MANVNVKEFKKELKALLTKYNASIDFTADSCSDWHGITGEKMVVSFREGKSLSIKNILLQKVMA